MVIHVQETVKVVRLDVMDVREHVQMDVLVYV